MLARELDTSTLLAHPSLLWDSIKLLHQSNSAVYVHALRVLAILVVKLPLNNFETQKMLWAHESSPSSSFSTQAHFSSSSSSSPSSSSSSSLFSSLSSSDQSLQPPPRAFSPLLPLVMCGLRKSVTREAASAFLHLLLPLQWTELVDTTSVEIRSLKCVISQLPWFAANMKEPLVKISQSVTSSASSSIKHDHLFSSINASAAISESVQDAAKQTRNAMLNLGWKGISILNITFDWIHSRSK
jgi:hypothetical protein